MGKMHLDRMYHELRELRNKGGWSELTAINDLATHLSARQGDYPSLLKYLEYYGSTYLVPVAASLLEQRNIIPKRIVELGAGLGWLSRGLSTGLNSPKGGISTLTVDRRQWTGIDRLYDLETSQGRESLLLELNPEDDLIVMSEFLHCLGDPNTVMASFYRYRMLVIEYMPDQPEWKWSYDTQVANLGCTAIHEDMLQEIFSSQRIVKSSIGYPYLIATIEPI